MNDQELLRYSRQIMLESIDIEGQERLLASHVLIVGAGGLGSPVALYLAAAGVGRLTLADADEVELSNLQRQIAHGEADLGRNKADSAREAAQALNPGCCIETLTDHLQGESMAAAVASVDAVLDCTDRFSSRYAINAACRAAGVPLISGAAIRFSGQLAVFDPRDPDSPCYACLYPPDGQGDEALSCAESGVVAPLVGLVGSFQALEAIKLLSGAGATHQGLSTFDGLSGEWRRFGISRDPACATCGDRASAP
ncbi:MULTISPECIES: molybdopterin-synthase adenylyltransferase MoeB [unclassified Halomonas]|uniref:HesA/MoeB/ThiF family protein n=1 Tax=unclassified Halomonas TaxID=2609666 RepID=UPI002884E335|nr:MULTISPECIES: molybdopterin-synthase adenylyltransferase MoeB [unclassified Halomonas]MDT0500249.1 molybdopterin-synthase adenylyltransferase MoeB [Halomonas sp. PAR7]MDT0511256.1 molybdopterin-synthase adenylyltransferase MoeB [Halomonas sp. LES1]MDT0590455.1 molybdopterin-synthase adenylyltransferase MoeB [Halomonas sp. PAR8]